MNEKGLMVQTRPTSESAKEYGLPCRKRRREADVRVVSSASSRQAVARGFASVASTPPEMGAYLCLFVSISGDVFIYGKRELDWLRLKPILICVDLPAPPKQRNSRPVRIRAIWKLEDEADCHGTLGKLRHFFKI